MVACRNSGRSNCVGAREEFDEDTLEVIEEFVYLETLYDATLKTTRHNVGTFDQKHLHLYY